MEGVLQGLGVAIVNRGLLALRGAPGNRLYREPAPALTQAALLSQPLEGVDEVGQEIRAFADQRQVKGQRFTRLVASLLV